MPGNSFGNIFKITTQGESHGKALGVVVDACPAGLKVSENAIQFELDRRRPGQSKYTTQRKEADKVDILSGVFTGANHGGKVKDPFDDLTGPQNVGHLFIVIKPGIFVGKNYISQIRKNLKTVKRLPKSNKIKEILYPGERKYAIYKKNLRKGIDIPNNILKEMNKLNAIK